MTLRYRNRFTAKPSSTGACKHCGGRMTQTIADGRETIIHELPWCEGFRDFVRKLQSMCDTTELHMAIGDLTHGKTTIIADGATLADVDVKRAN